MRTPRLVSAIALMLTVAVSGPAAAQSNTATTSAGAAAEVVTAIAITKTKDLNFGDVVSGSTAGTVVITPQAVRSATGGATLGNTGGASNAEFTVNGDAGANYSITLPSTDVTLTSGMNSMAVNVFTSSPSGTGTLSGGGEQTLKVGATLNVGASQPSGTYTGSFDVTVTYN